MKSLSMGWTCAGFTLGILAAVASATFAEETHEVDAIYRLFLAPAIDLEAVEAAYAEDVIHVGPPGEALVSGRESFLEANILPLASVINTGRATLDGRFLVVRRVVGTDLVHDVGYFHSKLEMEGRTTIEQLQKFSWVFRKSPDGRWQIVTDFDATPADLEVLAGVVPVRVIE